MYDRAFRTTDSVYCTAVGRSPEMVNSKIRTVELTSDASTTEKTIFTENKDKQNNNRNHGKAMSFMLRSSIDSFIAKCADKF